MNIGFINLNHMTIGVHDNTAPLASGTIARYLQNNAVGDVNVKLFKTPEKCVETLKAWKPDVLGISQYAWNSELNLHIAQMVKTENPDCIVIVGGPNLFLTSSERFEFLRQHSFIDLCIEYDGEIPFTEIVNRLANGESIDDIRSSPVAGSYAIDSSTGKLACSHEPPPRLRSLDVLGAMYADGLFDDILDDDYHPFLQTQRGCPFRCSYCHSGNNYCSKVIFQSAEYFRQDMEYLGQRFAGQHDITLYFANTNFGLFKQDIEIARVIREIQDKYDWPKSFIVNSGKNIERLTELLSILKYKFQPGLALQTLNPEVSANINRKNISFERFVDFQKKIVHQTNNKTASELILSLPGETTDSFRNGVSRLLNSGVQNIIIYTLMALRGTQLASQETAKLYDHVIKDRIVPRCFSEINGVKIFESEKVVVGTEEMPFENYIDLRKLALVIIVFASSNEMFPLRKFLLDHNLNVAEWIFGIQKRVSEFTDLCSAAEAFIQETKNELFDSSQKLVQFYSQKENYDLLCHGKLGDNLIAKYKMIILSTCFSQCLELAFSELHQQASIKFESEQLEDLLGDLRIYLKSRDVGRFFRDGCDQLSPYEVTLQYDIPKWLMSENKGALLEDYRGSFSYSVALTDYILNRLKSFKLSNRDPDISLQVLYRDGRTEDFWPLWTEMEPAQCQG